MKALAFTAVIGALAGVPVIAAPSGYTALRNESYVAEIPVGAVQVNPDTFRLMHDRIATQFTLVASTPHVDDRTITCSGHAPSYQVIKPKLFAYSCVVGGRIIYHVGKYGRTYRIGASNGTELIEFDISYPVSQRAFWDPVVAHISRSLRFPG